MNEERERGLGMLTGDGGRGLYRVVKGRRQKQV